MLNPLKTLFGAVAALTASTFRKTGDVSSFIPTTGPAPSRHVKTSTHGGSFGGTGKRIARIGGYRKGQPGAKLIRKMIRRYGYVPVMLTQPAVVKALAVKKTAAAIVADSEKRFPKAGTI